MPGAFLMMLRQMPVTVALFALVLADCSQSDGPEVLFCPADACADRIVDEIDLAADSIDVAIYTFTHEEIADALIRARERGVGIRVIGEEVQRASIDDMDAIAASLLEAGIDYRDDGNSSGIMHDKFAVIDGQMVLGGSFNYTHSADERNNENVVILRASTVADAYATEFESLWQVSSVPSRPASGGGG